MAYFKWDGRERRREIPREPEPEKPPPGWKLVIRSVVKMLSKLVN